MDQISGLEIRHPAETPERLQSSLGHSGEICSIPCLNEQKTTDGLVPHGTSPLIRR